jgi:hypothetical protein
MGMVGGGVADVSERARPGDDREHGDGQRVGDRDGPAGRPRPRPASRRCRCPRTGPSR